MGRASRGKERSDWQLLCKIAELAENAKYLHMHSFRRQAILGVALATAGHGGAEPPTPFSFRVFCVFCGFTLCIAPMEMIPKNGENRNFHDLRKREMKANLGDFGVKKQAILRVNSTYFALQCHLCSTSM